VSRKRPLRFLWFGLLGFVLALPISVWGAWEVLRWFLSQHGQSLNEFATMALMAPLLAGGAAGVYGLMSGDRAEGGSEPTKPD